MASLAYIHAHAHLHVHIVEVKTLSDLGALLATAAALRFDSQSTQSGNGHFPGVHSIMRVKSAQAGESGGCTPIPFTITTITDHVQSYRVRSS
jgi:hypothetical protein